MAIGDYLSQMFLGNSGAQEPSDEAKRGTAELWKLYQSAYNVRPVWDGKKWVIPPGAVQRFQMLLPMLQAQISAGNRYGGQQGNDKGLLAGMLAEGGKGLFTGIGKKMGGWEGVMDKVGGAVKGLFEPGQSPGIQTPYDTYTPEGPTIDTSIPTYDTLPPDDSWGSTFDTNQDWSDYVPTDSYDLVTPFTPEEYASAGDWW